ncbi:MAG: Rid family detoxifying hydrolase [Clostridia bacterium]|nr:Rid family detoxifying hydrolase [Clostridia bacterium]
MKNEYILSPSAPAAIGPYSHAVKAGKMLFISGQLGVNPQTGTLAEGVEAQADQALVNLRNILEDSGYTLADVVKTTVFLKDMEHFATVNAVYAAAFGDFKPARSCIAVAALPRAALFEIESIACKG